MIEFKSKTGSQVVRVAKTSAGVAISTRDVKAREITVVHVFDECIDSLILALLKCKKDARQAMERK